MSWMNEAESKRKKVESEASLSKRQEDDERTRDQNFWSQYQSTVEYLLRDMGNAWGGTDADKATLSGNPKKYSINSTAPYYHHDSDSRGSGWRHGVIKISFWTGDRYKPIYGAESGGVSIKMDGTKAIFEIQPNNMSYGQQVYSTSIDGLKKDLATLWQQGRILTFSQVGESLQSHQRKNVLLTIISLPILAFVYIGIPLFISSIVVVIGSIVARNDIILAIIFILSFIISIGVVHSWFENK